MASLEQYRAEALDEPFVLAGDDGTTVVIRRPPVDRVLDAVGQRTRAEVTALCGDQAGVLLALVAGEDADVLREVLAGIRAHFGLEELPRLAAVLERYGDHIQADLARQQVDMLDLWRGTVSPRTLLNHIEHLPRTSAYKEALAQDDELATARFTDGGRRPVVPISEYSPEVEATHIVAERLVDVVNTIRGVNRLKPIKVPPLPRPETATDRATARARSDALDDLEAKLFRRPRPVPEDGEPADDSA